MNPTDRAFPVPKDLSSSSGMDLRTYMAKGFVEAAIAYDGPRTARQEDMDNRAIAAIAQADALIARLNEK